MWKQRTSSRMADDCVNLEFCFYLFQNVLCRRHKTRNYKRKVHAERSAYKNLGGFMVTKKTKKKGTTGSKKAFGGYTINFKNCDDSLEKVFGGTAIPPSQMTKKLWAYVKRNNLNNK